MPHFARSPKCLISRGPSLLNAMCCLLAISSNVSSPSTTIFSEVTCQYAHVPAICASASGCRDTINHHVCAPALLGCFSFEAAYELQPTNACCMQALGFAARIGRDQQGDRAGQPHRRGLLVPYGDPQRAHCAPACSGGLHPQLQVRQWGPVAWYDHWFCLSHSSLAPSGGPKPAWRYRCTVFAFTTQWPSHMRSHLLNSRSAAWLQPLLPDLTGNHVHIMAHEACVNRRKQQQQASWNHV